MNERKKYYRQISGWLPCGGKVKKQLMANITTTVDGYLEEHPDANMQTLQAHFGTPQQIAASFVEEMDTAELLDALRTRRKVIRIILYSFAAIVVIWAIAVLIAWCIGMSEVLGYGVTESPIITK